MSAKKEVWILNAYNAFATYGSKGLNIENLSKSVGKSKSSFYHHFADLEIFTDLLLDYHLEKSIQLSQEIAQCDKVDDVFIHTLLQYKTDILFNKNLRLENNPKFLVCLKKSTEIIEENFLKIWSNYFTFRGDLQKTKIFIDLVQENFYLTMNSDNLNKDFLRKYFSDLKLKVQQIQNVL